MTRYEQGFMNKCAEAGLPPLRAAQLYSMRKQALSNAAIAGIGAGGGALLGAGAGAMLPAGDGEDARKKRLRNMMIGALLGGGVGGGVGYGLGKGMDAGIAKQIKAKGTGAGFSPSDNMAKMIGQARRTGAIDKTKGDLLLQRQIHINQAIENARNRDLTRSGAGRFFRGMIGRGWLWDTNDWNNLTPEEIAAIAESAGKDWDTRNGSIFPAEKKDTASNGKADSGKSGGK